MLILIVHKYAEQAPRLDTIKQFNKIKMDTFNSYRGK